MAALWRFGTIDIFVDNENIKAEVKRAELIPLDANSSTYHFFGGGSNHLTVGGLITSDEDYSQLRSWAVTDTSQTFTTPWGNVASAKINSIEADVVRYANATIDGVDYAATATPLYNIKLEIVY